MGKEVVVAGKIPLDCACDLLQKKKEEDILQDCLKRGILSYIDLFFAERTLSTVSKIEQAHVAFLASLFASFRQGHLALDLDELPSELACHESLAALIKKGAETFTDHACIVRDGSLSYLQACWDYKTQIVEHLKRLSDAPAHLLLSSSFCDSALNAEQQEAVKKALQNSVSFLTGGPGTGKTFTAARLVTACLAEATDPESFRILLMAPTGKAVFQLESILRKRISTPLLLRAGTLHALLQVRLQGEEVSPSLFADLIIVDESSMIDARLFAKLLSAVQEGTRLVFIGDKDQLPPIELGSIFADLLESDRYPSTRLTRCLRSDAKMILSVAKAIQEREEKAIFSILEEHKAWIDLEEHSTTRLLSLLWEKVEHRLTFSFTEKPDPMVLLQSLGSFAFLSCVKRGPFGVDAMNLYCLEQVCAHTCASSWVGIPVMVTANDYELELYNGDQGMLCCKASSQPLLRKFSEEDFVLFPNRNGGWRRFSPWTLPSWDLSYCLSVHKSQGSEYTEVLILAPPGSESFGREVLYTAVTRAKEGILLVSTKKLIIEALKINSRKCSGIVKRECSQTEIKRGN